MSSIMKGIVDEGAMSFAGLMTNFDDTNNPTIRDPDSYQYIPTTQYFQSHPEQQEAWQAAWNAWLTKRKQQAEYNKLPKVPHPYDLNSQVTPDEASSISAEMAGRYLSPEEQQKYKELKATDSFAAGRFLKQVWNKKTDQKQFANLLKVHWTSVNQLNDFLSGKIPNKAELSAVMYKSAQELPGRPSWGRDRGDQIGLILDGWTTIAGDKDLSTDNQRVGKSDAGTRSHQKYTYNPQSIYTNPSSLKTTKSELGTGWNEALVDNWKVKGLVVPQTASEETIQLTKQTKLPITYTGQQQPVNEVSPELAQRYLDATRKGPESARSKLKSAEYNRQQSDIYSKHHDTIKDNPKYNRADKHAGDNVVPLQSRGQRVVGNQLKNQMSLDNMNPNEVLKYMQSHAADVTQAIAGDYDKEAKDALRKYSNRKAGAKRAKDIIKKESSIMKGIVDESENVSVIYIDGKAAVKYANKHEAEKDANRMRERFPNRKIEIKQEIRDDVQLDENLHKWFKEKWVRFGPDGKIRGACARGDDSEGKPKCLPQSKAHNLGKKGRKYAASKKRREDPNPERSGKAINVATKKKTNEEQLDEKCWDGYKQVGMKKKGDKMVPNCVQKESVQEEKCPECGGPMYHESMMNEKKDACYTKVRSRYKVWPSAYASGALVQCRKKGAKNWGNKSKANEGVIIGHDAKDPQVAVLGGAGSYSLSNLKKKAQMEANQLAKDIAEGKFKNSAYNVKQLANTLNTIVAAEDEMEKLYFGEDYTGEFAAEKTPAINPYGGLKDRKFRGAISETPTDNPTGSSGEGGWRKYKPKSAGALKENTDELKAFLDKYPEAEDAMRNAVRHFEYAYDAMDHVAGHVLHKMPYAEFSKVRPALIAYFKKYGLRGDAVNDIEEDTAYAGGMGQGHSGESYRKFKPKSAGTFKESAILKGIKGA